MPTLTKLSYKSKLVSALAVTTLCSHALAVPVALVNADFEQGSPALPTPVAGGTHYIGGIPGWDVVNLGGIFEPDFISQTAYPSSLQSSIGDYTAYSEDNSFGLITQLLDAQYTFQADESYTLSVDVGARFGTSFGGGFGFFRLENPFPTPVAFVYASNPGSGNFTRQSITLSGASVPGDDLGDRIRIGFFAIADDGPTNYFADFDNVSLETTIPEPASLSILILASGLLVRRQH